MNPIFVGVMVVIVLAVLAAMWWMYTSCGGSKKIEKMDNAPADSKAAADAKAAASDANASDSKDAKASDSKAAKASASNGGKVLYIAMDGCGWCSKFDPDWATFAATVGTVGFVAEKHTYYPTESATQKNDDVIAQYVTGPKSIASSFPTILFVAKDGTVTPYTGSRSVDDLTATLHKIAGQ
jgi:hypothetical protein